MLVCPRRRLEIKTQTPARKNKIANAHIRIFLPFVNSSSDKLKYNFSID